MIQAKWTALVAVALLAVGASSAGLETDQFTVPPEPLTDLGPALERRVLDYLRQTIDAANDRRAYFLAMRSHTKFSPFRYFWDQQAEETLSPDYIADRFYDAVGHGLPECAIERWIAKSDLSVPSPYRFDISCDDSVYGKFWQRPLTMQELSPTINLYGVYFGTDKIGHLFQQGHEYYEIYRREERAGRRGAQAAAAAVRLGIWQEKGFYGEAMVGVYSNGDLAANYAGLKFYLNLTRRVMIRGNFRPSILVLRDGRWQINEAAGADFLKWFISDHFNESMNACRYAWLYRNHVRAAASARGPRWVAFYHSTPANELPRARDLSTWYGDNYGHSGFGDVFTAAEVCYPSRSDGP